MAMGRRERLLLPFPVLGADNHEILPPRRVADRRPFRTSARANLSGGIAEEIREVDVLVCRAIDPVPISSRGSRRTTFSALNFGDCLSYAVARLADHPLLFGGADFSQTDIRVA